MQIRADHTKVETKNLDSKVESKINGLVAECQTASTKVLRKLGQSRVFTLLQLNSAVTTALITTFKIWHSFYCKKVFY